MTRKGSGVVAIVFMRLLPAVIAFRRGVVNAGLRLAVAAAETVLAVSRVSPLTGIVQSSSNCPPPTLLMLCNSSSKVVKPSSSPEVCSCSCTDGVTDLDFCSCTDSIISFDGGV